MTISWYPGHMHKARKELAEAMPVTDVVIELLDARAPAASSNPLLVELRGTLPCVVILNKCDLADPDRTAAWQEHFSTRPATVCLTSGADRPLDRGSLLEACNHLAGAKSGRIGRRQALITGIPNVGKSTLLNHLLGRKVARTGNEPALTRHQQRIKLNQDWFLVDSPGMLWPKLVDQEAAFRLACLGTIRNTAVDQQDVAWFAAETLLREFYPLLAQRYRLAQKPSDPETLFRSLAATHGCLAAGGAVDWQRVSTLLLEDLRTGRLGRLTLEAQPGSQSIKQ